MDKECKNVGCTESTVSMEDRPNDGGCFHGKELDCICECHLESQRKRK